jgi:hypothetical protein
MAKVVKCGDGKPRIKPKPKPKLSDEARHKRFVDMVHEVDADESVESFDLAFKTVVHQQSTPRK